MLNLTPVVKNLLILNAFVFVFLNVFVLTGTPLAFLGDYFVLYKVDYVIARPGNYSGLFKPLQIVLSFFSHIKLGHFIFNMMSLVFLGPHIENVMGSKRFFKFYMFTGVVAGILITLFDPSHNPVIGASTALSGNLVAFGLMFPTTKLSLLFIPIEFEAKQFLIGFVVISLLLFLFSGGGGISHFGHLMGVVAGFIFLKLEPLISR